MGHFESIRGHFGEILDHFWVVSVKPWYRFGIILGTFVANGSFVGAFFLGGSFFGYFYSCFAVLWYFGTFNAKLCKNYARVCKKKATVTAPSDSPTRNTEYGIWKPKK